MSDTTVRNYLGYAGVPEPIRQLVSAKKLSAGTALNISRNIPDQKRAFEIAQKVVEVPRKDAEKKGLIVATARENPRASVTAVLNLVAKQKYKRITIDLTPKVAGAMEIACDVLETQPKALTVGAVEEWLGKRGFLS